MSSISVCITHYNRPDKLAGTLESLVRQTRTPDEVLLWDDASPRDPTAVAKEFQSRFKRFVYHRNENNLGMPGNLNAVLKQAGGDLIANLHDADEYHPRLLEKWESALHRHPDAGLVFCGLDSARRPGGDGRVWIHKFPECLAGHEFFRRAFLGTASSPIWGTVMARRDVYRRHQRFDPQYRNWSDVDMWMRICGTHDIAYVAEPLIVLDNSPTPIRAFSWEKFLITHRMPVANIYRIAANEGELSQMISLQKAFSRRCYWRHLFGRLLRGEGKSVVAGLRLCTTSMFGLFERNLRLSEDGTLRFISTMRTQS